MASSDGFDGTAAWLRGQWSNPSDIFTILLIIGGDIVQRAVAQLCAGPVPYFTPASFSFGWVAYAVNAMYSAVGENRLMPKPELDCKLINADTGYGRTNCSWILARLLRDFDHWPPRECDEAREKEIERLKGVFRDERSKLQEKLKIAGPDDVQSIQKKLDDLPRPEEVRVGLRVTVWKNRSAPGTKVRGCGDLAYWMGVPVSILQLGIAAIPWGLYGEWYTFLVTAAGTVLAYASGALPQWIDEKVGVRVCIKPKRVYLTFGNGAEDALLILNEAGQIDLEALASPQRNLSAPRLNQVLSCCLSVTWIAFLITVAGWQQHTWYLVGVGIIGIVHNVLVAGIKRHPKAWGFDLEYQRTFVEGKVMQVLAKVEECYPGAGASIRDEFFPGGLRPREIRFWDYASRRRTAHDKAQGKGTSDTWDMPPLDRPKDRKDDEDIPMDIPYVRQISQTHQNAAGPGIAPNKGAPKDFVVSIAHPS